MHARFARLEVQAPLVGLRLVLMLVSGGAVMMVAMVVVGVDVDVERLRPAGSQHQREREDGGDPAAHEASVWNHPRPGQIRWSWVRTAGSHRHHAHLQEN